MLCDVVNGQAPGKPPVRLYFERESGLLLRMVRYADTPMGRLPTQIDYADYRELGRSEDSVPVDAGAAQRAVHDSNRRGAGERTDRRCEVRAAFRGCEVAAELRYAARPNLRSGISFAASSPAEPKPPAPRRLRCMHPGLMYGECMARFVSTTVRLDEEDVRALKRARAAGLSASDLIRKGLRVVASRYYSGRRPPSTLLFESTNSKLGDESELFRDIED